MTFIETEPYNNVVNALAALRPCPFLGVITPDQIKTVLGETADIWPRSVAMDAYRAEQTPGRATVRLRLVS